MQLSSSNHGKSLSIFALVMINVIAVDSLRTLPISAEYGLSLIFYYVFVALVFFIPTAVVAAELATGWPKTGGLYIWVREAFNYRVGFLTIWLQWVYNIVWYPTILAFMATTLSYIINPALAQNKYYLMPTILGLFYLATAVNLFGIRISSFVSIFGAIVGTLVPMILIIILGSIWLSSGFHSEVQFNWHSFWPNISSIRNLVFVTGVLFGLVGMEMSAVHAGDVKNPQRDYPRALFYSTVIILTSLVLASLAIAIVVPHQQLNLVSGLLDAFDAFFKAFHIPWMSPVIDVLIIIGALSGVSAWVIGPTRGLYVAVCDSHTLEFLQKTNRYGAPQTILLLQAAIFTVMCSAFIIMPSINSSYWLLSALTAQLALIVYLFMFAAVVILRYKKPDVVRSFQIPGGKFGVWLVASVGSLTCIAAIAIGFLPPSQMSIGNILTYEVFLFVGIIVLCLPPILLTIGHRD